MINALEIKQKLSLVAMDKMSLNAFEDWFVPRAWNVHKSNSEEAIDLVSSIHLFLSERDDNVLNEAALRQSIVGLLNNVIYAPVKYAEQISAHFAPVVVKGSPQVTVRYRRNPITSSVSDWSARPAPFALASVRF